ncbi:MAG: GGDEF domain-containing protein [Candidatus Acidiferrales bacterium]
MTRLLQPLELPRPAALVAGILFVPFLGVIDVLVGYEVSFSLFYLLPVFLVAWAVGAGPAYGIALACAASWYLADRAAGANYSHPAIPYWNASLRLGFFLVVAYLASHLREAREHESALARTDSLTGAANKRAFLERAALELGRAARYSRPLTLAYIDLDNFKQVNDRFGHSVGDRLLYEVAQVMQRHVRATDLVVRLGGDEFALLIAEMPPQPAREFLAKIQSYLLSAMKERDWPVTFSIGAVVCMTPPRLVDDLLKFADDLMYEVKRGGKNRIQLEVLREESILPPGTA